MEPLALGPCVKHHPAQAVYLYSRQFLACKPDIANNVTGIMCRQLYCQIQQLAARPKLPEQVKATPRLSNLSGFKLVTVTPGLPNEVTHLASTVRCCTSAALGSLVLAVNTVSMQHIFK